MKKKISRLKYKQNDNDKKYKVEKICDNTVYAKKSKNYLPSFYFLVL